MATLDKMIGMRELAKALGIDHAGVFSISIDSRVDENDCFSLAVVTVKSFLYEDQLKQLQAVVTRTDTESTE